MQLHRAFEILYLLMERENMSARDLAERFEVSTKTIYRDVDLLSGAGIPIYAARGKGGGIRLLPGFVLNKTVLTGDERNQIMAGLQSLAGMSGADAEPTFRRLTALLGQDQGNWLEVDHTGWYGSRNCDTSFEVLKQAIFSRQKVEFLYYNGQGQRSRRQVEPLKLLFKSQKWYLYGYCQEREEERIFKLSRILELEPVAGTEQTVTRAAPPQVVTESASTEEYITLTLKVDPHLSYRVYDEFYPEQIAIQPDGSFLVIAEVPAGKWFYGYLLSLGAGIEVLQPESVRQEMRNVLARIGRKYEERL